jgi:hypothetical protein
LMQGVFCLPIFKSWTRTNADVLEKIKIRVRPRPKNFCFCTNISTNLPGTNSSGAIARYLQNLL